VGTLFRFWPSFEEISWRARELSTDQHRFRTLVVEVLGAIDAAEVAQDVKLVSNSSAVDARCVAR
jgi:hypothetical protein